MCGSSRMSQRTKYRSFCQKPTLVTSSCYLPSHEKSTRPCTHIDITLIISYILHIYVYYRTYVCVSVSKYMCESLRTVLYRGSVLYNISNEYMGVRPSLCVAYVLRCAKGKISCVYIERDYILLGCVNTVGIVTCVYIRILSIVTLRVDRITTVN